MNKICLKKNPSKKLRTSKGFTLLEALVATSILMVAVVAPITIAQKGLSSAVYSKNQIIASYLAQDAIEYIKNKRDEVAITNNFEWDNLWTAPDGALFPCLDSCEIDTVADGGVGKIIADADQFIKKEKNSDGNFEFYGYNSGDPTNFKRKINIKLQEINGKLDEALITVTVDWGGEGNNVVVRSLMYNF